MTGLFFVFRLSDATGQDDVDLTVKLRLVEELPVALLLEAGVYMQSKYLVDLNDVAPCVFRKHDDSIQVQQADLEPEW